MYDIIGDIHGHAATLERLLVQLGYELRKDGWQQTGRKVIFVGDLIDSGPEQLKTISIVKTMVDNGHALAVLGNHEFNAVAWTLADPHQSEQFLRPHSAKNLNQHKVFLEAFAADSRRYRHTIDWFKQLPLYLELDGLRIIHACWHPSYLATLAPHLESNNSIQAAAWPELCHEGSDAFAAVETLLKGVEIPLPPGVEFTDKYQHVRQHTRIQWWLDHPDVTYRDLALVPKDILNQIPHDPVPADLTLGYDNLKPLFIGHYWMRGTPRLLSPHIVCLDWSIAAQDTAANAKLCAYQWHGERTLTTDNLLWTAR